MTAPKLAMAWLRTMIPSKRIMRNGTETRYAVWLIQRKTRAIALKLAAATESWRR